MIITSPFDDLEDQKPIVPEKVKFIVAASLGSMTDISLEERCSRFARRICCWSNWFYFSSLKRRAHGSLVPARSGFVLESQ